MQALSPGRRLVHLVAMALPLLSAHGSEPADGAVAKRVLDHRAAGPNLLRAEAWRPYEAGCRIGTNEFFCDNGGDARQSRGVAQTVTLNQAAPRPIVASAWSRAEGVSGSRGNDYALYLDLIYTDGTPLWGQTAPFSTGTHTGEWRSVTVVPDKPVRTVSCYLLLRGHAGSAAFRNPELRVVDTPAGATRFDGLPVSAAAEPFAGFLVRDVAAGSDFVRLKQQALGLGLTVSNRVTEAGTLFTATLTDTTGRDRAVTLICTLPVSESEAMWLAPGTGAGHSPAPRAGDCTTAAPSQAGMGRLSLYPFAAVAAARTGRAIGVDMDAPAHFRTGYSADTRELYVAWDIGLTPEKPVARVGGCTFAFPSAWGFRAALAAYYGLFPGHFRTRIARQGVWMPFAKISALPDWQDFGFRFKEGNDETAWDDAHDVLTFRYTEPLTWWMALPRSAPRTLDAARAEARRLAPDPANAAAQAFLTSVFHDEAGSPPARILDTPWCNGAVWSMNSAPGVAGAHTDFRNKWNPALRAQLYGAARKAELDGEYVDSSEGYVTAVLDFRREHFAAAEAPLTFSPDSHRPAVYRGLMAWEYARAIATDMHAEGRYMMANATPYRLCWLAPLLDVMGTETDWNPGGRWRPMSREDLFYRRALCAGKPYCLLMNTDFKRFPLALTERYMQRCLAYGMLPGFFSADASTGHYFTRPELYERDRGLFRRYVPLCRRVAEAGWQPVTRARTNLPDVGVERFGTRYMTLFNDGADACRVTVTLDEEPPAAAVRELLAGASQAWTNRTATLSLGPEAVAVLDLMPK